MDKPRILVVDDEQVIRELFERRLEKKDFEVHTAENGEKAISKISEDFFNVTIIDLKMPGIEGMEILKTIKRNNPYVEVIVITGFATPQSAVEAMKLGAFDYVTKPFDLSVMEKTIDDCLEKQKLYIDTIEAKELIALFNIGKTITSAVNLDALLEGVLKFALQITKAKKGSLMLLDEAANELEIKAAIGLPEDVCLGTRLPVGEGISGQVAKEGKPLLVSNVEMDPRVKKKNGDNYEKKSFLSAPLASAPFIAQDKVLGVINVSDKLTGDIFTQRDLTLLSVLSAEASIAIANVKLYSELQDRVRELEKTLEELRATQAQLIQSEKLSSIGTLAAGIAHELGNSLVVISGWVRLLSTKESREKESGKGLGIIGERAAYASKIIEGLLKFAKPTKPEAAQLDINKTLEEVLNLTGQNMSEKNINIVKNIANKLPKIQGDGAQLKQVFVNIMLNAKEAMPKGGTITVTTSSGAEDVKVMFADTGCGISKENICKIFDPFFTTKEAGTGLGLSVSYRIIKEHGGDIGIESEENKGTTITVKLPVAQTK